jgi:hypothetical protein
MHAPPLAHVTGTVEPGEAFGGFGPVDAFLWRGACIGGCGARPGCRAEESAPECSGCGRARHGITGDGSARGIVGPVLARVLPGELGRPTTPPIDPSNGPSPIGPQVLRPAADMDPADAGLPSAVRGLLKLAGDGARVTAAVAARPGDGGIVASLAVRVPGVGFAVYTRGEGGAWATAGAVLVDPHLRRIGVTEFAARLAGVEYAPPAPRPPAAKAPCPGCGAEVSVTKDGKIYASHRCRTGGTEGRS